MTYTSENLRAASPEKCKHTIGGKLQREKSYGTVYLWYVCLLCQSEYNHLSYQDYQGFGRSGMNDYEDEVFNRLTGKFKHYCLEYDGLAIDETCEEFKYCLCFSDPEPKEKA